MKKNFALFRALKNESRDAPNVLAKPHCYVLTNFRINVSISKSAVAKLPEFVVWSLLGCLI